MRIYALGDLHLSGAAEKPMDLFGAAWENHPERIMERWNDIVSDGDLVLIPGDISWAMHLNEAIPDLEFIGALRGTKVLMRGNHDYWWSSLSKVRSALPSGVLAIQNDSLRMGSVAIGGSRGWTYPGGDAPDAEDAKIYERELGRLRLSLSSMPEGTDRIAMLHYPPFLERNGDSPVTALLEEFGVSDAVYGHLHGPAHKGVFEGEKNGVNYHLVAADYLDFTPKRIR